MKKFLFFAGINLFIQASLFANRPDGLHNPVQAGADVNHIVDLLEQNSLMAFLGMTLLAGFIAFFCIGKCCTDLVKKTKKSRISSLSLLIIVVVGLSVAGSSCSAIQQAQLGNMPEGSPCICRPTQPYSQYPYGRAGINNQHPHHDLSAAQGSGFCKYCGRRVYQRIY